MSKAVKGGGAKGLVPRLRFPEFRGTVMWQAKPLAELCARITNGSANAQDHEEGGIYPLFDRSEVVKRSNSFIFDAEVVILPGEGMRLVPRYFRGKFNLHQRAYGLMEHRGSARFVYYALDRFNARLLRNAVKSTVPSLRLPIIERFIIPVPDDAEQQKIADCLSSLDDLIAAHTDRLAAMKQHKQGLLKQIFSYEGGAMPRARFPEFRNNSDWHTFPLGDVCEIETGRRDANEGAVDGAYPFFTCAAENLRINTYSFDEEAILIAGNANVGQTTYYSGKFDAYQRTYVLTRFRHVSVKYLYHFLDATLRTALSSQVQTGAMSYIRLPMLTAYPVMAPRRIEEQVRIAALLSNLAALLSAHADKLTALKQHKQGLLQQLFPTIDDTTQP